MNIQQVRLLSNDEVERKLNYIKVSNHLKEREYYEISHSHKDRFQKMRIQDLLRFLKIRRIRGGINDEVFPCPNRLWLHYHIFEFGKKRLSFKQIIEDMRSNGCQPANSHELALYEGAGNYEKVVGLGSIIFLHGCSTGLLLHREGTTKDMYLIPLDSAIKTEDMQFLGVSPK